MYKKRETRYYKIRVEVVWGIVVGVLALLMTVFGERRWSGNGDKEEIETAQEDMREAIDVSFEGMKSELNDTKECYLCGNNDRSLMWYYRKFDTIGLISLNDWYVMDFPLKNYDRKGNEIVGDTSDNTTHGNTGGISYSRQGTISRGMAEIDVTLPQDYELDTGLLQKNPCQECLDKVAESLEYWKWEDEEREAVPLCLVDFETLEIYPMQNKYVAYFIRDYWIEMDFDENKVGVGAYYLPERQ